jgi:hypothetical protein
LTLRTELRGVNEALWDVEEAIRACDSRGDFGASFVALAQWVYRTIDRRAALKRQINELLHSELVEEKEYGRTPPSVAPAAPEHGLAPSVLPSPW